MTTLALDPHHEVAGRYIPNNAMPVPDHMSSAIAYVYEMAGVAYAVFFSGRKRKADFHFRFKNEADRAARIEKHFESVRAVHAYKAKRKEEAKAPHTLKVGDIMCCSWGWEQTNVDFYQIVATTEKSVTIRAIHSADEESNGYDSGRCVAVKDAFKSEVTRTFRANHQNYLKLNSYSGASLWDGKSRYWSRYA